MTSSHQNVVVIILKFVVFQIEVCYGLVVGWKRVGLGIQQEFYKVIIEHMQGF